MPARDVRRALDGQETFAAELWREIAGMGWIGAAIPEVFGGAGLGYEGLCVLAEAMGRAVAPVPFASTAYLAAEAILTAGNRGAAQEWLPKLADGSLIGCFALSEGNGNPEPAAHPRPRRRRPAERDEMAGGGWRHRRMSRSWPRATNIASPACSSPT